MKTDDRLDALLDRWEEGRNNGGSPAAEELCRDCPELLPSVRERIQKLEAMDRLLPLDQSEAAGGGDDETTARRTPPELPGYEILGQLGYGGMGVVYQARQLKLNRIVALKVISAGTHARPEQLKRFRTEAEAAARLQHPNIVAIYEVGEHEGLPYLAMEFVEGTNLARKIAGVRQEPRQSAELVETLARAMQHAHERGVVHRDLKPANILLQGPAIGDQRSEKPSSDVARLSSLNPKITDFGLAKCLESESEQTHSGAVLGTPSYMAPEQAAGKTRQIGPPADVYALGAILYELLTARPPFRAESSTETLMQVISHEVRPVRQLQPTVPRDLETITLKCLAKEPDRRYRTAGELAEDLRRSLAGEPIHARPPAPLERLWKWVSRFPARAALVGVVAVSLVVVTGLWLHAVKQQWRADKNLADARRAVREHFVQLSEIKLEDQSDPKKLRRRQLEAARKYFLFFLEQARGNPEMVAEVADAHFRFANITDEIGSKADAEAAYREACDLYIRLLHDNGTDRQLQNSLARCLNNLGLLQRMTARPTEAIASYQQAHAIWAKLVNADPASVEFWKRLAGCHDNIGNVQHENGNLEESLVSHREALTIRERLAQGEPADPELQNDLAKSANNFGIAYHTMSEMPQYDSEGNLQKALSSYQKATDIGEKLVLAYPLNDDFQNDLAATYHNIGNVQRTLGNSAEALSAFRQAKEYRERLAHAHPAELEFQIDLAASYYSVGNVEYDTGKPADALVSHTRALAIRERLAQAHPTVTDLQSDLAASYKAVGVLRRGDDPAEAVRMFQRAIAVTERLGLHQPATDYLQNELTGVRVLYAVTSAQIGQHAEATAQAASLEDAAGDSIGGETLFNLACVWSCASSAVHGDTKLSEVDRDELAERYAVRAVELLKKARTTGFVAVPAFLAFLKQDQDLAPLRSREDFQKLLSELDHGESATP